MSADGSITLVWGDGENVFRFAIGQFRELQENVNRRRVAIGAPTIGPMDLLRALEQRNAWPDDVRDILRIGLIGGGMKPAEASRLMVHYLDGRPLLENVKPAHTVLATGLVGVPEDEVGAKKKPAAMTAPDRSPSRSSTEAAPR